MHLYVCIQQARRSNPAAQYFVIDSDKNLPSCSEHILEDDLVWPLYTVPLFRVFLWKCHCGVPHFLSLDDGMSVFTPTSLWICASGQVLFVLCSITDKDIANKTLSYTMLSSQFTMYVYVQIHENLTLSLEITQIQFST